MNQDRDGLLKGIQIAAPCQSSWDAMQGDDKQRFCKQCSLNVYNLSAMTEPEIAELFAQNQSKESICVSFFRRSDGTILTENCPVGLRRLRQSLRKLVTSTAAMMSILLTMTTAQARRVPFSDNPELLSANPEFQKAAQDYKFGRYKEALAKLDKLSQSNAAQDVIHYYKALCLQSLNQFGSAQREYAWTAANTNHPQLKAAAQKGLEFLSSFKFTSSEDALSHSFSTYVPAPATKPAAIQRTTGGLPLRRGNGLGLPGQIGKWMP